VRDVDPLEVRVYEVADFEQVVGRLEEEEEPLVDPLETGILPGSGRLG
jgi:hypothetical protein